MKCWFGNATSKQCKTQLILCLHWYLVTQKIKIMNLFCLPEYSILIGHYETIVNRFAQYFYFAKSHVNNTFLLWCWSNSFVWHVYWFVNIPIRKRLIFVPIQIGVWYILAKNIAFWLVDLMQPFFRAWRDFTASHALISEATILLNWLES